IGWAHPTASQFVAPMPWLPNGAGLDTGTIPPPEIWKSVQVDLNDPDAHKAVNVGPSTYISGAMLRCYDGEMLGEAGPAVSPFTNITTLAGGAGGSLLPSTTYHYRVFFMMYTANAERFLSNCLGRGANDAVDISVTTGVADTSATVKVPCLAPTLRLTEGG